MANAILSVGYLAALSRHLKGFPQYCCYYDIPQPFGVVLAPSQAQKQVDPRFSIVELQSSRNTASYQSLQAKLERRFSGGLTFIGSYTYSKNLGILNVLSDPRFPMQDRAPLNNDITRNFVFPSIWQLPFGSGRRWANIKGPSNQIIGGWQLSEIIRIGTGFPFTPTLNNTDLLNLNGVTGGEDRPDRICNGTLGSPTLSNWFDKSCFVLPQEPTTPGVLLRQGTAGHNILRGPGAFGIDVGLGKHFLMTKRYSLEFRAEAFNFLNHPTFGLPASGIDRAAITRLRESPTPLLCRALFSLH